MKRLTQLALATALLVGGPLAAQQTVPTTQLRPDQQRFRAIYKELVETNTTLPSGSCTLAAERMAAHRREAGYPGTDLTLFSVPEHPKDGGLVAVLPGSDPRARPILLLAHLDVVEARREDWTRDPFTFIEENGYFYARGVSNDKAQADGPARGHSGCVRDRELVLGPGAGHRGHTARHGSRPPHRRRGAPRRRG